MAEIKEKFYAKSGNFEPDKCNAYSVISRVGKFLGVENVPANEISLREAATAGAMGSGQGFVKCGCTKGCQKRSCNCYKNNVKCNSKCHTKMSTCDNKTE